MSTEMDWSPDYCLSCDRQISEGAYCSQACRLADLEKSGQTDSLSPLSSSASSTASYASHAATTTSGFYLPPALNFASYNRPAQRSQSYPQQSHPATTAAKSTYTYSSPPSPTYLSYTTTTQEHHSQASHFSVSSSRSHLTTLSTADKSQGLSPQAASALRGYVSSFDQVRETKRRYRS